MGRNRFTQLVSIVPRHATVFTVARVRDAYNYPAARRTLDRSGRHSLLHERLQHIGHVDVQNVGSFQRVLRFNNNASGGPNGQAVTIRGVQLSTTRYDP